MKQKLNLIRFWSVAIALVFISALHAQPVTFNFEGVDIRNFINQVSELTGKNFIVHPGVTGKITVVSSKPLTSKEIYMVFLSVLEVHGFSAVPSGNMIKIIPSRSAKQENLPTDVRSSGSQMVTQVVHVTNVSATQLTRILRPLMPQQAHLTAYDATNTLVITDRANNVKRMLKIIKRIDQVSDAEVDIIPLKHASATEVVNILKRLQKSTLRGKNLQRNVRLAADQRTNSVLLSGERSSRIRMRAIINHMDTKLVSGGNTHVIYLRYVNAKKMVSLLTGVSKSINKNGKRVTKGPTMPINIQADESNNALVITAPPDIYRSLQRVITKLDIRRAQVLVEAIIVDMSAEKARELGLQWIAGKQDGRKGIVGSTGSRIADIARSISDKEIPEVSDGLNLLLGQFTKGQTGFAALLSALQSDTSTNILSTPSIMTLDNKKAEIKVGQNVPFLTGQYTPSGKDTDGSVTPFQTIQRKDVGLTLIVKPQINEGNAIMLEIDQEVSSISTSTVAKDLITNKRTIKTTVMVENGQIIVLGGLIDERLNQTRDKVPLLGSIPLIGKLFRYNSAKKEKRNLMVFLRPVIVNDAATQQAISSGKYQYIRQQQIQLQKKGVALLPDSDSPLLNKKLNFIQLPGKTFNKIKSNQSANPTAKSAAPAIVPPAQVKNEDENYFGGDPETDEPIKKQSKAKKSGPADDEFYTDE